MFIFRSSCLCAFQITWLFILASFYGFTNDHPHLSYSIRSFDLVFSLTHALELLEVHSMAHLKEADTIILTKSQH